MSELELEALIVKVSADIERQTEVLQGLQRNKSHLHRRLNALRDPMARLPLEIAAEIFLQCLPSDKDPRPSDTHMLLLNVCHAWTDIAISTPRLWAELYLDLPQPEGFPELLQKWLQWARTQPLNISLDGYVDVRVVSTIWLHSHNLTSLHVDFSDVTVDDYYEDGHYNALGGAIPQEPLLCLEELSFVGRTSIDMSWRSIFELLRLAPNLVDLDFRSMPRIRPLDVPKEPVLLPNLRKFSSSGGALAMHLQCITAPRLENLTFRSVKNPCDDKILSFLRRSSPPLRVLELADCSRIPDSDLAQLPEFLSLLPTMDHLKLGNWGIGDAAQLIRILPERVPNLRILELFYDDSNHPASDPKWNMLATSLRVCRGSRVQSIRLTVALGLIGVKDNTRALFRELGAGGMDVRVVDDDGQDLLSAPTTRNY
ncbi:hypothetical protein FB45DRAFT_778799 [Roridomyces roridus]|uniref:F-box domain-containing protein n=1 Tax=Roridomyces roridus TaxID=1738132 RepID=A0AAD7CIB7_9AGAR|nr:hypothetical protein FB45DRAFT_778799 [Roridomyces roridus]